VLSKVIQHLIYPYGLTVKALLRYKLVPAKSFLAVRILFVNML